MLETQQRGGDFQQKGSKSIENREQNQQWRAAPLEMRRCRASLALKSQEVDLLGGCFKKGASRL